MSEPTQDGSDPLYLVWDAGDEDAVSDRAAALLAATATGDPEQILEAIAADALDWLGAGEIEVSGLNLRDLASELVQSLEQALLDQAPEDEIVWRKVLAAASVAVINAARGIKALREGDARTAALCSVASAQAWEAIQISVDLPDLRRGRTSRIKAGTRKRPAVISERDRLIRTEAETKIAELQDRDRRPRKSEVARAVKQRRLGDAPGQRQIERIIQDLFPDP